MELKKNKYPIYIISKGRYKKPLTAKCFIKNNIDFKILVEPQEYQDYCNALGEEYVVALPFSNLGLGSYPARNHCFELSKGYERHWCFDDNITEFWRLSKGKRWMCHPLECISPAEDFTDRYSNVFISGFNYESFVTKATKKPFVINTKVYSGILLKNNMPFRWRLKYNEDVDLALQILHNEFCTIQFNAFLIDKVSTIVKMEGGNQDELYKNNAYEKKILKAKSLEKIWPQYAKTVYRFNRPHHHISWKKHFKHPLIKINNDKN